MLSTTVISRAPVTGAQLLNHSVAGATFTAAPTVVTDGFKIRNQAGNAYDALEFTFSFDATAGITTEAQIRSWFWVPDHDPAVAGGTWLAGRIEEGLTISTASSDIQAPVRRINAVPTAATRLYLQVVAINGAAPLNVFFVAYGISGFVADVAIQDLQVDIEASGITIGAVQIEDHTTTDRVHVRDADAAHAIDDHVLVVQHQDADNKIMLSGADADAAVYMRLLGMMGAMSGPGTYVSPIHFTGTWQSVISVDLAGHPAVTDVSQFLMVVQISSVGVVAVHYPHVSAFSWDAPNDRLSVAGVTFVNTDIFGVVLRGTDRYANDPGNYLHTAEVNAYPLRSDDAGVALIAIAQDLTANWVDLGAEISLHGFNTLKIWATLDINDSLNPRIRVLDKHTAAGAEEYTTAIETIGTSDIPVESAHWEWNIDADQLMTLVYKTEGATPYAQVQVQAGVVGVAAGQIDAAYYTRGWR